MKNILKELLSTLEKELDAVLVTVISSTGSAPRASGAHMLVKADGSFIGTVGGGMLEFKAIAESRSIFETKTSFFSTYELNNSQAATLGMICGGRVTLCYHYVSCKDEKALKFYSNAHLLMSANKDGWLIFDITNNEINSYGIYSPEQGLEGLQIADIAPLLVLKPDIVEVQNTSYYCEPLFISNRVYVFGGGHVAQALVPVLTGINFRCTVIEDRPEFLTKELFPQAEALIQCDFEDLNSQLNITNKDYVVIVTRGHQNDYKALSQALKTQAIYIGVIGSRTKAKLSLERLVADGYKPEDIGRVICPIGLEIGAETPAEIAISIAAQMIKVRASHSHSISK